MFGEEIVHSHDTVEQVVSTNPLNLSFRRTLVGVKLTEYINLVAYLREFNLADERDTISWKLHNNGQFSVRSMYQKLINQQVPFRHKYIWKLKIPQKIKIFLWAYWLRFWALLQPAGTQELLRSVSKNLETMTLELFSRFGWKFNNRLGSY
ncbi:hypothetical protein PVAP13_2NG625850 [Panicum virgatum]|uniref:Reverse transcriptase zinc-binding domain-containing protein n=1 Tax=Panicum virgatum TaxID=38727 RepID=A0A8T0VQ36_PANVG|nr:hypothetical protein PVAP13_2NG625850 [Panicum virgatum]